VEPTDAQRLVAAAASGDAAAWRVLVEQFSGLVWSITRAHRLPDADAADVFQTTWLRLAEHIGRIESPERIGAWLATAARRECLQTIRASARTVPTGDDHRLDTASGTASPTEDAVIEAEQERLDAKTAEALWQALERLPDRCRHLLRILMASPPPSYADVAAALGVPVGSIGPTRARCLRRLRAEVQPEVSEPALRPHDSDAQESRHARRSKR
jgi:RNA polymerase sigma factor (sigma-70 family)